MSKLLRSGGGIQIRRLLLPSKGRKILSNSHHCRSKHPWAAQACDIHFILSMELLSIDVMDLGLSGHSLVLVGGRRPTPVNVVDYFLTEREVGVK